MRPPRLSIAGLLGVVLVSAVGLAALRAASGYWAAATVTLTLLVLLAAAVGALVRRDRAGWVGFAVFGWGYFLVAFAPWFADDLRPHLLTSVAITESFPRLHSPQPGESFAVIPAPGTPIQKALPGLPPWRSYGVGPIRVVPPSRFTAIRGLGPVRVVESDTGPRFIAWGAPDSFAFERIAHALFALLAGLVGALVARVASRDRTAPARSDPEP